MPPHILYCILPVLLLLVRDCLFEQPRLAYSAAILHIYWSLRYLSHVTNVVASTALCPTKYTYDLTRLLVWGVTQSLDLLCNVIHVLKYDQVLLC